MQFNILMYYCQKLLCSCSVFSFTVSYMCECLVVC